MKKISLKLLVVAFSFFVTGKAMAQDVTVSYQTFYDELSPYGQWVNDGEYGNVWVPDAGTGYRPYATDGHWAMTENGNMWVSDAPFGWACYHYGRWTYNSFYGWVWVPGYEWAPAWVSWRSGGGYYGWAPMAPGYAAGGVYDYPDNYWVFVGPQYLYEPNVYGYYRPGRVRRYIRETTYMNDTYVDNGYHSTYNYGPRREAIERETHQPVQVYQVSGAATPRQGNVSGNVVQIYRPAVNADSRNTARPAQSVKAVQPVGRPQSFTRGELRREPEFRQQTQAAAVNQAGGNQLGGRQQSFQQTNGAQQSGGRPQPQRFQSAPQQNVGQQAPQRAPQQNSPQQNGQPVGRLPQAPQNNQPANKPQMQQPRAPQARPQMQQSGGGKSRESEHRK